MVSHADDALAYIRRAALQASLVYKAEMALVKLVDPAIGSWAKVELREGDIVADLADRACAKFPNWGVNASQVSLYLVEWTGEDVPSAEAERIALDGESLQPTWSLTRARIVSNSCILVRKSSGAAAAGACAPPPPPPRVFGGSARAPLTSPPSQTRWVGAST